MAVLVTVPRLAVKIVCPAKPLPFGTGMPVANPVALMVAALKTDDVHCTLLVRSAVSPLRKRPVAVNCFVVPGEMVALTGVTLIETN